MMSVCERKANPHSPCLLDFPEFSDLQTCAFFFSSTCVCDDFCIRRRLWCYGQAG